MIGVHHVGWLVKHIDEASEEFEKLGFVREGDVCRDEFRGVDILFMTCGHMRVELVSPYRENSDVSSLMKTHKNSPYHICLSADDIEEYKEKLERDGFARISNIAPAPGIGGRNVIFLINPEMGMVELLENEKTGDGE